MIDHKMIAEWLDSKTALAEAQAKERQLREQILTESFGPNNIGSRSTMCGNYMIKGVYGLDYKIDQAGYQEGLEKDLIDNEAMGAIRIKYELDKKAYDGLSGDAAKVIDGYLTVKPTMPSLEIKLVKEEE